MMDDSGKSWGAPVENARIGGRNVTNVNTSHVIVIAAYEG